MVCYEKSVEKIDLSDSGLVGSSRAENLNVTYYVDAKYDFSSLKAWNGLFSDFRKSTDLDNEKKEGLLRKIYWKKWIIRLIGLVGTSRAENLNVTYYVDAKYDFNSLKG